MPGLYKDVFLRLIEMADVDPESAHDTVVSLLQVIQNIPGGVAALGLLIDPPRDNPHAYRKLNGIVFKNQVLLAEGFDKNGRVLPALLALGFSSVMVGTVTEKPQSGSKRPRILRHKSGSIINWMGFPSEGANNVASNLAKTKHHISEPIGISIGLNKNTEHIEAPASHARTLEMLYDMGEYFIINASSPNTPDLRALLIDEMMERILTACLEKMIKMGQLKPIFIKFSPDMTGAEIENLGWLCEKYGVGIVATNTTTSPELKQQLTGDRDLKGGVSGPLLQPRSTEVIQQLHRKFPDLPIIGQGGIDSLESAKEKLSAGATLLAFYSALIFQGPYFPGTLIRQLNT